MKDIQEVHLDMKGQIVHMEEIVKQQNLQLKKNINRKLKLGADKLRDRFHNLYPKEKEIDQIVSASRDKSIIFWNADGSPKHIHKGEKQYIRLLELRTGNIAAASGRNLEIIDRKEGHVLSTLQGHENSIQCIEELSSGELVTGSQDSTIRIWDLKNNIPLRVLKQHTDMGILCQRALKWAITLRIKGPFSVRLEPKEWAFTLSAQQLQQPNLHI